MDARTKAGEGPENGMVTRFRSDEERWEAVRERDRRAEGYFVFGVVDDRRLLPARMYRPSSAARERPVLRSAPRLRKGRVFGPAGAAGPAAPSLEERHAAAVARACRLIESAEEAPDLDDARNARRA